MKTMWIFPNIIAPNRKGTRFKLRRLHCEALRDIFWYRACYRAHHIMEFLNPDIQISIKAQIRHLMWNNFINTFNEQNLCSH